MVDDKFSKFKTTKVLILIILIVLILIVINLIPFIKDRLNHNSVKLDGDYSLLVSNQLPLTDVSGKKLDIKGVDSEVLNEISFNVLGEGNSNKSISYELYLVDDDKNNINSQCIKVYLTDENDLPFKYYSGRIVPTYFNLRVSKDNPSGKVIFVGDIKGKEKKKFKLRIWVADNYGIIDEKKSFKVKLGIRVKGKK